MVRPLTDSDGTFSIGGDLPVRRLGYGAMRITGEGIFGPPADRDGAIAVLRRAVELGITLIDTADSYGPDVSEELIAEALHPYPDDLVIATKAGLERPGPGEWVPNGRPEHLRARCESSLARLRADRIDLFQLHRIDPAVPAEESLGTLGELQAEGKIRHIGLSEVTVEELTHARTVVEVVSVQNRYNLGDREWEPVVDACEADGTAFLPWFPLGAGELDKPGTPLDEVAVARGVPRSAVALAWLLRRSPVLLPIPGTSSVAHLDENVAAAELTLSDDEFAAATAEAKVAKGVRRAPENS